MLPRKRQDFRLQRILVEETIRESAFTQRILSACKTVPVEIVADANDIIRTAQGGENREHWDGTILLAKQRGPFLRLCPGTPRHICCMYHNLDVAAGCDLNCSYCILQAYLNTPLVTLYCNLDDLFLELSQTLSSHPDQFFRIGTGELTDSLTFDQLTGLGREMVDFFAHKSNAIIEIKTKSVCIENILDLKHNRRTVVSWSLNSDSISRQEESTAPGIDERLAAAREVQNAGYRLGFHFDPMIDHPGWEEGYRETVDKIFRFAKPGNIAWISLGALRYPPALEEIIRQNHPASPIVLGELLPGVDKKLRYFKPIRVEMFRKMYQWIRSYAPEVMVYLCMESDEVWRKAFGWSPGTSSSLKKLLDAKVQDS